MPRLLFEVRVEVSDGVGFQSSLRALRSSASLFDDEPWTLSPKS